MKENVMNELIARRFLLGDMSVEERERIEELAFGDPETFSLLQSAQDDLIDDFVNDELSSEERERFQNYFLAQPGRRQDLSIGRALQQYLGREQSVITVAKVAVSQPMVSIFDWFRLHPATASLIVLLLAVVLLVVILTRRTEDSPRQAQHQPTPALPTPSGSPIDTPVQTTPSPSPTAEIQNTPTPSPRHPVQPIYVVLVPGGPARSEGEEIKVRPVRSPVSFELPVVDNTPYQHYQALLQRNGNTIRPWSNLQPKELQSGRALKIDVPAGLLDRQRYRIIVMGLTADGKAQPVHTYYFNVSN